MQFLYHFASAAPTDTSNFYGLLSAAVALVIAIGVPVGNYLRTRGSDEKTRQEIITLVQTSARDSLRDALDANERLEKKVNELVDQVAELEKRAGLAEAKASSAEEKASVVIRGFNAVWQILERSTGHSPATKQEQRDIDAARALIGKGL